MKKMLLLSAALIAAMAGPAMAQRDGGPRGEGPRAGQTQQQYPNRSGREGAVRPQQQQQNRGPAQRQDFQAQQRQAPQQAQRDFRRDNDRRDNRADFRRDDRRDYGRNDRGWNDNRRWDNNRGWDNRRYSQYYRNWNSSNRYRAGVYYRPSGYYYRRWTFGDILPSIFWSNRYWLNNYYAYDLPPPPAGTVWVRYGDDALLIDRFTGEVIQVSYSVFW